MPACLLELEGLVALAYANVVLIRDSQWVSSYLAQIKTFVLVWEKPADGPPHSGDNTRCGTPARAVKLRTIKLIADS